MPFRPSLLMLALLSVLAPARAMAQADASDASLPQPELKLAPALVPPPLRGAPPPAGAPTPGTAPSQTLPLKLAPIDVGNSTIFLRAEQIEGVGEQYVEASGKVELRTRRDTVLAEWLRYDFPQQEVWAKGDVVIRHGLDWMSGPEVRYRRDTETGFFTDPTFYVGETGGRGSAAELAFVGPDQYKITAASYTTCVAPNEDWYIRMGELDVDKAKMEGTGHDATLNFLGAPVAYTPWLDFPLSNDRKSGFLTPIMGSSGTRGLEYAQPYYFNLAPNYDATLIAHEMTKRGLQFAAQGRYLFENANGEADVAFLDHDQQTGTNRYAMSWQHNQTFAEVPGLAAFWNLNKVSDNTYFTDLSDRVGLTSQTTLPRVGGFSYTSGPWQVIAQAQAFQTLADPTVPPGPPPYNRVPQLYASLQETDFAGLTFSGHAEYADFRNPVLVEGQRAYAWPTVGFQRQGSAWFFNAQAGVHARTYELDSATPDRTHLDYVIPITSVDAGLTFERDWDVFGESFIQTLEPRAYYVYVPYRNQSAAPIFDTALDDYNFSQLFSPNRYLGNDRIGDANQLTLALSSRLLDPATGAERLRLVLGERFYFQAQQVVLNEVPRAASSSDLLVGAEGRLSDVWALTGLWQYNFDTSQTEKLDAAVRYTPAIGKVVNVVYRYSRLLVDESGLPAPLKQFDVSAEWPINGSWTALGRWNYSLIDSKTLEAEAGIEYNAGCWTLRVVGQRLTTTTQTTTNSVYVQIELNGLARFGNNPLDLLRRSIPGYQKTNDPAVGLRDRYNEFTEF